MLFNKISKFGTSFQQLKQFSVVSDFKEWLFSKTNPAPTKLDLSRMRISPIDTTEIVKDRFIPLTRSTLIRKLSQDSTLIPKSKVAEFEDFSRFLDACISNRLYFFFKEVKTGYETLNPDVEKSLGDYKLNRLRSQILDDEFWFSQKLCHLLQLANFRELDRSALEHWLNVSGGPTLVQAWVNPGQYEMLKVWVLSQETPIRETGFRRFRLSNWWPVKNSGNPYMKGDVFRRVVIAVRVKSSDKVELKLFKNLSLGELIHILPRVHVSNSRFDNSVFLWTGSLLTVGLGAHFLLTSLSQQPGWILSAGDQLALSFIALSIVVGATEYHVTQKKKSQYWEWCSKLNYNSIVANNSGVISLLSDRAHDEVLKEALLAYTNILKHTSGISQKQLELEVESWVQLHSGTDYRLQVDLEEAVLLLRQLGLVSGSSSGDNKLTAKELDQSLPVLGTEYRSASSISMEQHRGDTVAVGAPHEAFEKLR